MFLRFFLILASLLFFFPSADKTDVISAADGVTFHYSVTGKGKTALVFIHCGSCDRHVWDNQVPVFSKEYKVVTMDLPGHGEAGLGRKNWSVESFADDVTAVVKKLNLKRVVLIGSSMGGPIAVEVARRIPERVAAIVPVDTLQNVENKLSPEQLDAVFKQLRADYKGAMTGFVNQFLFSANTPEAVKKRIISEVTSRPPEPSISILQGILAYDAKPALVQVKVPIRAINSDLNPTMLEINRKYAPQFDVVVIKGTGHYPMLEDPARFNGLLTDILRSLRL